MPKGGNAPQAWFRRSRERGPKGNGMSLLKTHSYRAKIRIEGIGHGKVSRTGVDP